MQAGVYWDLHGGDPDITAEEEYLVLKKILKFGLVLSVILAAVGCGSPETTPTTLPSQPSAPATSPAIVLDFTVDADKVAKGDVTSGASVHDPSVLRVGDTYYIYGSHMTAAKSTDLKSWQQIADGYSPDNPVYGAVYDRYEEAFAWAGAPTSLTPTDDAATGGEHVWAADVTYNREMGKYVMYYCTTSTYYVSNLCYAVSDSPEGPFQWQGALIYTGFSERNLDQTNVLDVVSREYALETYLRGPVYNYKSWPNAIDPAVFYDQDGKMWMVYGSFSGGIFILEIDPYTGRVIHPEADPENRVDPYFGKWLCGGNHKSIEAPYILYARGYYYLFVSYGSLVRNGGYQIRVFRSEAPDGPYVDMNGGFPDGGIHADYGLKLSGNYDLPSLPVAYMATGHNSALADGDGKYYVVHHTRFDSGTEYHSPRAHQFLLNRDGWPCLLPYQTQGETVSQTGYEMDEILGRYYLVLQDTTVTGKIPPITVAYLLEDGKVYLENGQGSWTAESGTYYMSITLEGQTFQGVFCQMPDEAGNVCMTFSAVGANESLWGVRDMSWQR